MTLKLELMNAILAMDSYNRGYDQGINLDTNSDGNSTGIYLGTSRIITESDIDPGTEGVNIGFYALAYDTNDDGQADIISYRGTDFPIVDSTIPRDITTGWTLGGGLLGSEQGEMAVEFYQAVTGVGNHFSSDVTLVGHSLGGGLAGFVGALYDQDANVYDSMTYKLAAEKATNIIVTYLSGGSSYTVTVSPQIFADFSSYYPGAAITNTEYQSPKYGNLVHGGNTPNQPNFSGIKGYYIEGEALDVMLPLRDSSEAELQSYTLGYDDQLGPVSRHSMATLVIRMFAEDPANVSSSDWQRAAEYFWPALYSRNGDAIMTDFARDIGMTDARLAGELQASGQYDQILRTIIAYSAIDEGERPFGDTAIRSMYNDANDLGKALSGSIAAPLLTGSSQIALFAGSISKVFVEYAGQLALNKVLQTSFPAYAVGVLAYNDVAFNRTLGINFSEDQWMMGGNDLPGMVAQADLLNALLDSTSAANDIRSAMSTYWGDGSTNAIERVFFNLLESGATILNQSASVETKGVLFVGGSGNDMITGSAGNDLILGGDGVDTFQYVGQAGITIDFNSNFASGGAIAVSDQSGSTDILHSVEKIVAGSGSLVTIRVDDTSLFDDLGPGRYLYNGKEIEVLGDKRLELGSGNDGILLNAASGITIDGGDGYDTLGYFSFIEVYDMKAGYAGNLATRDHFINFEEVTFDSNNPLIRVLPDETKDLIFYYDLIDYSTSTYSAEITINGSEQINYVPYAGTTYVSYSYSKSLHVDVGSHEHQRWDGTVTPLFVPIIFWPDLMPAHPTYRITGTNLGDTYNISSGVGSTVIKSGFGNDTVELESGASGITYIYTKGNDDIHGARGLSQVSLGYDIRFSDLTFSLSGAGSQGIYNLFNLSITIANHGSLILRDIAIHEDQSFSYTLSLGSNTINIASNGAATLVGTETLTPIIEGSWAGETWTGRSNLNETFHGYGGNDILSGGGGNDTLIGGWGNDTLTGGSGNDTLQGGLDDDIYFYTPSSETGTHVDTIIEGAYQGYDVIRITGGLTQADFTMSVGTDGSFIFTRLTNPNGSLVIAGIKGSDGVVLTGKAIEKIIFDNNSEWNLDGGLNLSGTSGDDVISGTQDNDIINGFSGNDTISGYGGDDTFLAGLGSGLIDGGDGQDTVSFAVATSGINANLYDPVNGYGVASNSTISVSLTAIENIYGSAFADTIRGDENNNTIRGGAGADNLDGRGGVDTLDLSDYVAASGGPPITTGANVNIGVGYDTANARWFGAVFLASGNDSIYNFENVIGTNYNDQIQGTPEANHLIGGNGNDTLTGKDGGDILDGGAGTDTVVYTAASVVNLSTGTASDGLGGTDTLIGIENVTGSIYSDNITGSATANSINAGGGNDTIIGLAGNDTLNGGAGEDILEGGIGNDSLFGGLDSDTYIFSVGHGLDTISENANEGADTIHMVGILSSQVNISVNGSGHVIITNSVNSGDRITVTAAATVDSNGIITNDRVERILFDDGTIIYLDGTSPSINGTSGNDTLNGTANADVINGYDGNDTLNGLGGNDTLNGGNGNDAYIFGSGLDTITETGGSDTLRINPGWTLVDIDFSIINTNDLKLTLATGTDELIILNQLGSNADQKIETLEFEDGFTINLAAYSSWIISNWWGTGAYGDNNNAAGVDIDDTMIGSDAPDWLYGYEGNDTIYAKENDDALYGGDGNDRLHGAGGNDTLDGGNGDDVLWGGTGSDLLKGGAGNDIMYGGTGNDQYLFEGGMDVASESSTSDTFDRLSLGTFSTDTMSFRAEDIGFSVIFDENVNEIYVPYANIEYLEFAHGEWFSLHNWESWIFTSSVGGAVAGTSASDTIIGRAGVDVISVGQGDDSVYGGKGSDTLYGQDGNDTLIGGDGDDILYGGSGGDGLHGGIGNDYLYGGEAWDFLSGGAGNDYLDGGTGLDTMYGGAGNDTYIVDDLSDIVVEYAGEGTSDLVVSSVSYTLGDHVEQLHLTGGANINGTGNNLDNIIWGNWGGNTLRGGGGNDTIVGQDGLDTIIGDEGNDILSGGLRQDVFKFVIGTLGSVDTITDFNYGDGDKIDVQDLFVDYVAGVSSVTDFVQMTTSGANTHLSIDRDGTGSAYAWAQIAILQNVIDLTDEQELSDMGQLLLSPYTPPSGEGTSGSDTILGSGWDDDQHGYAGDDTLYGYAGFDFLDGGSGADTMYGGGGDDTYIVDDVNDVVVELSYGGSNDLIWSSVTYTLPDYVEGLYLSGGNVINATGNSANNYIQGNWNSNVLRGGDGNDMLVAVEGNDFLIGDAGTDLMYGGYGADTFVFEASSMGSVDVIADFSVSQSDKIDVSDLLFGYDPLTDLITDFVEITTSGSDSILKVDRDGTGTNHGWQQIATINNVTDLTNEEALVTNGNLIV